MTETKHDLSPLTLCGQNNNNKVLFNVHEHEATEETMSQSFGETPVIFFIFFPFYFCFKKRKKKERSYEFLEEKTSLL